MNILVTGGAGFIGSHVAEHLLNRNDNVTVLDEFNDFYEPQMKEANLAAVRDRITLHRLSLSDRAGLEKVFKNAAFDAVIHLAARAGVRPSIIDPALYVESNIVGTLNLLEAMREAAVYRLIFGSSSSVYGLNKKVPFAEDDLTIHSISPYAATKLAGEQLACNYAHLHGFRIACLRFFTVYGPRQRPDLAIAKFTQLIEEGSPIDQYGDGQTSRDYTYIDDIVSGVIAALDYLPLHYEILNLGGHRTTTLARLIELIENALGKRAHINQLPDQRGDVPLTYADITKAHICLGYQPKTSIEEGIVKYINWYVAQPRFKSLADSSC